MVFSEKVVPKRKEIQQIIDALPVVRSQEVREALIHSELEHKYPDIIEEIWDKIKADLPSYRGWVVD